MRGSLWGLPIEVKIWEACGDDDVSFTLFVRSKSTHTQDIAYEKRSMTTTRVP